MKSRIPIAPVAASVLPRSSSHRARRCRRRLHRWLRFRVGPTRANRAGRVARDSKRQAHEPMLADRDAGAVCSCGTKHRTRRRWPRSATARDAMDALRSSTDLDHKVGGRPMTHRLPAPTERLLEQLLMLRSRRGVSPTPVGRPGRRRRATGEFMDRNRTPTLSEEPTLSIVASGIGRWGDSCYSGRTGLTGEASGSRTAAWSPIRPAEWVC